jgi:uncharacterized protein (TIGR02145 family)
MQYRAIRIIIITACFVMIAGAATSQTDSILIDNDGNKYPVRVLLDGNLWMAANLDLNIPNSFYYGDSLRGHERLGRLYTWESARQGCESLGKGWRLPTLSELIKLTLLYGGAGQDSNLVRKEAYQSLLYSGSSGFDAQLGGGRDAAGRYARLDAHGFYWTSTAYDSSSAWYCNFAGGSKALYMQDGGEKTRAFSVRCVKSGLR